eukprot:Clim_evm16s201 gene=Clim_evmTU16s201
MGYANGVDDSIGTYVTDYVGGVVCLACVVHSLTVFWKKVGKSVILPIHLYFAMLAVVGFCGGIMHHYYADMRLLEHDVLACLCLAFTGLAGAMGAYIVSSLTDHPYVRSLRFPISATFSTVALYAGVTQSFVMAAMVWLGAAMYMIFCILVTWSHDGRDHHTNIAGVSGLCFYLAAAGVFLFYKPYCGVDDPLECPFPEVFNHNAVLHCLQIVGFLLFHYFTSQILIAKATQTTLMELRLLCVEELNEGKIVLKDLSDFAVREFKEGKNVLQGFSQRAVREALREAKSMRALLTPRGKYLQSLRMSQQVISTAGNGLSARAAADGAGLNPAI